MRFTKATILLSLMLGVLFWVEMIVTNLSSVSSRVDGVKYPTAPLPEAMIRRVAPAPYIDPPLPTLPLKLNRSPRGSKG